MSARRFIVAPGVGWVAGAPTPVDRRVVLTDGEAQFDLGLGRIALDPVQPVVPVPDPVAATDDVAMSRDAAPLLVTVGDLVAFLAGGFGPALPPAFKALALSPAGPFLAVNGKVLALEIR